MFAGKSVDLALSIRVARFPHGTKLDIVKYCFVACFLSLALHANFRVINWLFVCRRSTVRKVTASKTEPVLIALETRCVFCAL